MRLAIFSDTFAPQVNGVARTLGRLADAVRQRGGDATVVTVQTGDAPTDELAVMRWPAVPFWAYPELRIASPRVSEARRLLRALKPDLVHAATPFGIGLAARAAARAEGIPLVSSFHTDFPAYLRYYGLQAFEGLAWPYLRWFHNGGRRTFVPTGLGADELSRHGFTGVRVWGRGVDAQRFSPTHRSRVLRQSMGVGDGDMLFLSVGRLAPEKGIEVTLEAVRELTAATAGRIRVAFVGDGPAAARYRATAPEGTIFTGRLEGERLSEIYASADAFVFSSTTDTFGNVLLEAMASGLPVIATDRGPTLDVAHAGNACVVPAQNPRALAGAMRRMADDAAWRLQLRTDALHTASARTWERVWDALFSEYESVLANHSAPRVAAPRSASARGA